MALKYFLIVMIFVSVFFAVTLIVSSNAFAQNLTVHSIFISPSGEINGSTDILEGTNEEIASQYYKLGEEFEKKADIKPGDIVSYMLKNNSVIKIPYTGEYKNPGTEALLNEVFIPLGEPGDRVCWIDHPLLTRHWVCTKEE